MFGRMFYGEALPTWVLFAEITLAALVVIFTAGKLARYADAISDRDNPVVEILLHRRILCGTGSRERQEDFEVAGFDRIFVGAWEADDSAGRDDTPCEVVDVVRVDRGDGRSLDSDDAEADLRRGVLKIDREVIRRPVVTAELAPGRDEGSEQKQKRF